LTICLCLRLAILLMTMWATNMMDNTNTLKEAI
jgi:hypothetical protein